MNSRVLKIISFVAVGVIQGSCVPAVLLFTAAAVEMIDAFLPPGDH